MIQYYDWLPQLESLECVSCISKELLICSLSEIKSYVGRFNPFHIESIRDPHKFDFFMVIYHKAGRAKMKIDMEECDLVTPSNIIGIHPGQIVSIEDLTPDFDADILLMSHSFIEEILVYMNGGIPIAFDQRIPKVVHCAERDKNMVEMFVKSLRHILRQNAGNPYLSKIVQHVIMAIFYSLTDSHDKIGEKPRTNADVLSKEFLSLVKEHFREERQLKFYADKMCITPRYLSRVVKECTKFSAADWIERFVVLEARALLKSTNMTIQQISDELNFPSQTFFGKYFKRRVGLSPKEYRRMG